MPIYYNQTAPTSTSKNTINSIMATLPNIRDFLLLKNLVPTGEYLFKLNDSPSVKIGQPILDTESGSGSVLIPNGLPLETEGILWKEENVLPNMFKNLSITANNLKSIDYIPDIPFALFGSAQWPQGIQSYPKYVIDEVKMYGLYGKTVNAKFKNDNTLKNLYLDETKQIDIADMLATQPVSTNEQIKGYLDQYGALNLGGSAAIQAANVIGGITTGGLGLQNGTGGLGFAKGGVVPNFDIRSSLAGRVLGATGLIKDTKLGKIGGQQLALALANNAAFNLQQDILGALNIQDNVLSLVKGQGFAAFPRPSYNITVPESGFGRIADYTSKVLGFTIPRSYISDNGSIFQTESGEVTNIDRANALILTTGKGQLQALLTNANANLNGIAADGKKDNPSQSPFRSGYAPGYLSGNKKDAAKITANMYAFQKENGMINLFSKEDGVIADLSYLREDRISGYGFKSPEETGTGPLGNAGYDERKISDVGFTWTSNPSSKTVNAKANYDEITGDKKSLLVKTQKLFNSTGMLNIVTVKGDMNKNSSQLTQANGKGFSKGNAVMTKEMFGYKDPNDPTKRTQPGEWNRELKTADETYCRSWTTLGRYDTVSKMVRSHELYSKDSGRIPFRFNTENSVLEDTGFVHIAPYTNDFLNENVPRAAKNYMLSIENLAWFDRHEMLPKGELGPGDPITGKKGRIMWFPPYDIQFSESTSVDWEAHKFIGRGENMYTYNNTERSGQLSFKIIVDHSTYTNTFRGDTGPDDHYVASFMAGCIEPDSIWTDKFTSSQTSKIVPKLRNIPQEKKEPPRETPPGDIFVFFPNDQDTLPILYECGVSGSTNGLPDFTKNIDYSVYLSDTYNGPGFGLESYPSQFTYKTDCANNNGIHAEWPDTNNFGLNYSYSGGTGKAPKTVVGDTFFKGILSDMAFPLIDEYITTKCPHCRIEVTGYASPQGREECNQQLADARADNVISMLWAQWAPSFGWSKEKYPTRIKKMPSSPIPASKSDCNPATGSKTDTFACKFDRRVKIHFEYDAALALEDVAQPEPCIETTTTEVTTKITQQFYNETMFFDKLKKTDKFIFDRFRDKIKYFHPAFHSTTPEGLNSRLTFLQQCTRQGPTDTKTTNNLAFGRPPVCILRVGDFFNTKIIIDSLNIEYEPLVWDLNPEGIGVQPMIANVSLSFKFIGAESLYGPINKLQNALSFNYYANSGVYEPRADFISQEKPANYNGTSSTGLYLNDGIISTKDDPKIDTHEKELSKVNSCDVNQVVANEKPAAVQTTPAPTTASTEPKITGFKYVDINGAGSSNTQKVVTIAVKQENIEKKLPDNSTERLISNDELKKLLEKGLKFVIEGTPTPSNTSRYEEIVKWGGSGFKDPWYLFGFGYALGTIPAIGSFVVELPEKGNYMLTMYYDNKKVQSVPVIVGVTKDTTSGTSERFQQWYD